MKLISTDVCRRYGLNVNPLSVETTGSGAVEMENCRVGSGSIRPTVASAWQFALPNFFVRQRNIDGDVTAQAEHYRFGSAYSDLAVRNRGTSSVRIEPKYGAGGPTEFAFKVSAPAGASTLAFYLRKSAAFDGADPTVTVSGGGLASPVASTLSVAADTWQSFVLSLTNPGTAGEYTVTVSAAGTAGEVYFDGMPDGVFVRSCRHYGYMFDESSARRTANPQITMSEAAAAAVPGVSVDHDMQTITVTAALTSSELWHRLIYDMCLAANQGRVSHVTEAGPDFTTSYAVIIGAGGSISGSYTSSAGRVVTITAPNLIAGTRVQLYDLAGSTELFNGVLATAGLTQIATWTADRQIRLRADHATKLPLEIVGLLTQSGLSFIDSQDDDTVYLGNGIDGSTCTEFIADGANIQVDVNDPDGVTSVQRLYAWMQWYQTTAAGIASPFFGAVAALDSADYLIDQALADIKLDNVGSLPVLFTGGYLARRDGTTVIASTSGSIQMDPGKAYIAREASADLAQIRKMVEADTTFTAAGSGAGTMRYFERGTTTELIPPKSVTGTGQPIDSALRTP